jgi:hypothetical protein
VSRRIDIELTSARDDGTWTWRAAGAKQPRGVLEQALLYEGARVGDVVRADAEIELDGITVTAVHAPKGRKVEPERLAVLGPERKDPPPITSSLVAKRGGRERPASDRPPRDRDRAAGDRPPRDRAARPPRDRDRDRPRPDGRAGPDRGGRERQGADRPARADRPGRAERPAPESPSRPRPKRLNPASTHRKAVLDSLPPEQRPIADQLLRGGMPAVRQSIAAQNSQARAEGKPETGTDALLAMAEQMLPGLKTAEWLDRAEAAAAQVDDVGLRDLRSVVASADGVARDDRTRLLASTLREALERRVKADEDAWVAEIATALDESRLVRALRLSARGPEPSSRCPAEMATRLATAASEAMSPETTSDRWVALLEAVTASPVRRAVKPAGLPAEAPANLIEAATAAAGQVPALAPLLGLKMPPPPSPTRRPRPGRPPASPGAIPPPPPPDGAELQPETTAG